MGSKINIESGVADADLPPAEAAHQLALRLADALAPLFTLILTHLRRIAWAAPLFPGIARTIADLERFLAGLAAGRLPGDRMAPPRPRRPLPAAPTPEAAPTPAHSAPAAKRQSPAGPRRALRPPATRHTTPPAATRHPAARRQLRRARHAPAPSPYSARATARPPVPFFNSPRPAPPKCALIVPL